MLELLAVPTEERPPILFGTCDWLLNKLKPVDAPTLKAALQRRRKTILSERKQIKDAMERPDWPRIGWIDP